MSAIDDRLAATAAGQHALLTRPQVLAAGGSDSIIRRRLGSGRWERVLCGVYAIVGVPWSWRRRLCALLLTLDPAAAASHRAAAKMLGAGGDGEPPYEFVVPVDTAPRPLPAVPHARPDERPLIVHESVDLARDPIAVVDGIRVTPPRRLVVDLGAVVPFDQYRITVARLEADHGLTRLDLEREYRRHSVQGRNGCGALRDLLDIRQAADGAPDEIVEMLLADLLTEAGLPAPVHQHRVRRGDGKDAFFDLAYPDLMIAMETEGAIHRREDVHQQDHERRNQLLLAGWIVLHFTYWDVVRRPQQVVSTIRNAIATRTSASTGF